MAAAKRLYINPGAPAATAKAAATATTAPMQSPSAAPAASINTYDFAIGAMAAWGSTVHQVVATTGQVRGTTVGAVSAAGAANLDAMDEENTADLTTVGQ